MKNGNLLAVTGLNDLLTGSFIFNEIIEPVYRVSVPNAGYIALKVLIEMVFYVQGRVLPSFSLSLPPSLTDRLLIVSRKRAIKA